MSNWRERAACTGVDPDVFFPPKGNHGTQARAICEWCPVAAQCLQFALTAVPSENDCGIFGGTGPRQRRAMRKAAA